MLQVTEEEIAQGHEFTLHLLSIGLEAYVINADTTRPKFKNLFNPDHKCTALSHRHFHSWTLTACHGSRYGCPRYHHQCSSRVGSKLYLIYADVRNYNVVTGLVDQPDAIYLTATISTDYEYVIEGTLSEQVRR